MDEEETESEISRVNSMVSLSALDKTAGEGGKRKVKKKTNKDKDGSTATAKKKPSTSGMTSSKKTREQPAADSEATTQGARIRELEGQLTHLQKMYALTMAHNDGLSRGLDALRGQLADYGINQDFEGEHEDVIIILQQKTLLVDHLGLENSRLTEDFAKLQQTTDRALREAQEKVRVAQSDAARQAARVDSLETQLAKARPDQEELASAQQVIREWEEWAATAQREFQQVAQDKQLLQEERDQLATRIRNHDPPTPVVTAVPSRTEADEGGGILVEQLTERLRQLEQEMETQRAAHVAELQVFQAKRNEQPRQELDTVLSVTTPPAQPTNLLLTSETGHHGDHLPLFHLREEDVASAVEEIKAAAERRVVILEKDHQRKLRELEDRLQIQARGEVASLALSHEDEVRDLRERVSELEQQAEQQVLSLDATLSDLFEAKGMLEQRLEETQRAIEAKDSEIAQFEVAVTKLKAHCDLGDRRLAEERTKTQELTTTVGHLEVESARVLATAEKLQRELRAAVADRARLERDLLAQQQVANELRGRFETIAAEVQRVEEYAEGNRARDHFAEEEVRLAHTREDLGGLKERLRKQEWELVLRRREQDAREARLQELEAAPAAKQPPYLQPQLHRHQHRQHKRTSAGDPTVSHGGQDRDKNAQATAPLGKVAALEQEKRMYQLLQSFLNTSGS